MSACDKFKGNKKISVNFLNVKFQSFKKSFKSGIFGKESWRRLKNK